MITSFSTYSKRHGWYIFHNNNVILLCSCVYDYEKRNTSTFTAKAVDSFEQQTVL